MIDPLWSETCWSNFKYFFKYFIIILIVSTNCIFVHLLDNKVFCFLQKVKIFKLSRSCIWVNGNSTAFLNAFVLYWTKNKSSFLQMASHPIPPTPFPNTKEYHFNRVDGCATFICHYKSTFINEILIDNKEVLVNTFII